MAPTPPPFSPERFMATATFNVKASAQSEDSTLCTICYLDYGEADGDDDNNDHPEDPIKLRVCGHIFGKSCLNKHVSQPQPYARECPKCRAKLQVLWRTPLAARSGGVAPPPQAPTRDSFLYRGPASESSKPPWARREPQSAVPSPWARLEEESHRIRRESQLMNTRADEVIRSIQQYPELFGEYMNLRQDIADAEEDLEVTRAEGGTGNEIEGIITELKDALNGLPEDFRPHWRTLEKFEADKSQLDAETARLAEAIEALDSDHAFRGLEALKGR